MAHSKSRNQKATVWVGNLEQKVDEALLYELMLQAGPVVAVNMQRDKISGEHSGWAFVEFASEMDAEYSMKVLNFVRVYGKPIRVNPPSSSGGQDTGVGANVFVGNLDTEVDDSLLYTTFSAFGQVLSARVMCEDDGGSRGFGFVNFADFESSDAAIRHMDSQFICNRAVHVGYAYKKDATHGERHGDSVERRLADESEKNIQRPHTQFASAALSEAIASAPVMASVVVSGTGVTAMTSQSALLQQQYLLRQNEMERRQQQQHSMAYMQQMMAAGGMHPAIAMSAMTHMPMRMPMAAAPMSAAMMSGMRRPPPPPPGAMMAPPMLAATGTVPRSAHAMMQAPYGRSVVPPPPGMFGARPSGVVPPAPVRPASIPPGMAAPPPPPPPAPAPVVTGVRQIHGVIPPPPPPRRPSQMPPTASASVTQVTSAVKDTVTTAAVSTGLEQVPESVTSAAPVSDTIMTDASLIAAQTSQETAPCSSQVTAGVSEDGKSAVDSSTTTPGA